MIVVYEFVEGDYVFSAAINEEDGTITGSSKLAKYFRDCFDELREQGYDPVNQMDKISNRIYNNYRGGYYWAD